MSEDVVHPGGEATVSDARPRARPERIPEKELRRVRFDMHAGAVWAIIRGLINSEIDYPRLCKRAGHRRGYFYERFRDPLKMSIEDLSDFCLALGAEPKFRVRRQGAWFEPEKEFPFHRSIWVRDRWRFARGEISALAVAASLSDGPKGQDETAQILRDEP